MDKEQRIKEVINHARMLIITKGTSERELIEIINSQQDFFDDIEDILDKKYQENTNPTMEQIKESVKAESNDSPKAKSNDFAKEPNSEVEK